MENQRVIPDTPNGCKGVQIDSSMDMHDDMVLLTQTLENKKEKDTEESDSSSKGVEKNN